MELDLSALSDLVGQALGHEITRWTIALGIAAWIHSSQVRKEIKNQMASIVYSIDNVARALRMDLDRIDKRLEHAEERIDHIESKQTGS